MIRLGKSEYPMGSTLLQSEGGFAWWYFDWVGADGTELVIIPSFGLPFLPGYASSAREGAAPPCGELPSLNVCVYKDGTSAFYLLQRYPDDSARWDEAGIRMGRSHFTSQVKNGVRHFEAHIDCPVPGTTERLTGHIHLQAPSIQTSSFVDPDGPHAWTPLAVGPAEVHLSVGDTELARGSGRAYHDRNGCSAPLEQLGIRHWVWGRVPFPHGEHIHYLLWPEDESADPIWWEIEVDHSGRMVRRDVHVQAGPKRTAWFGMPWWPEHRLIRSDGTQTLLRTLRVLDDGPFYLRNAVEVTLPDGQTGHGVGEIVYPTRVDRNLERPLVRMAVHKIGSKNSPWLPLFCGPRSNRWRRLITGAGA